MVLLVHVVQTIAGLRILPVYAAVDIVVSHHVGCLCVEKHHLPRRWKEDYNIIIIVGAAWL